MFLSVTGSIPLWLVQRWIERYSFNQAKTLCDSINEIPWITVRTNTLKTTRSSLSEVLSPLVTHIRPAGLSDTGLHCSGPKQPIQTMDPFIDGWFQIQDEAAQLVTCILDPKPGDRVLDACAGLGGKTGHMAGLMQNKGQILALDTDENRLSRLTDAMSRMGVDIVETIAADLMTSSIDTLDGYFDRILLDAPCSGLGVIRRHPDARWNRKEKDIFRMAALQKKMLFHASNMVKPGGYLLYTVCSCEPEETEKVIIPFISKRTDFTISHDFREQAGSGINPFVSETGFFSTYPEPGGMDGFFAALLKREPRK
jgi:16S rRNA (cytosine967-C5)-methyltransferase